MCRFYHYGPGLVYGRFHYFMYVLVNLCIIDNISTAFLVVQIPLPVSGQTAPEKSGEAEAKTSVSFFLKVFSCACVCGSLVCWIC